MVWTVSAWLLVALAVPAAAAGQLEGSGHWAAGAEGSVAGRYNPVGVSAALRTTLRYRFFPPGHPLRQPGLRQALFAPSSVGLAATVDANPAFVRGGVGVEFMPAAVWRTRITYQAAQTFGTFGYMTQFPSRGDAFDGYARWWRMRAGGRATPRIVQRLVADTQWQARVWRFIALDLLTVDGNWAGADGWFYNGEYDLLVHGRFEVVVRNIGLVALSVLDRAGLPELSVGMFHGVAHAWRSRGQNQQLGAAVIIGPPLRGVVRNAVSVILLAGMHTQSRSRELTPYMVGLATVSF
ncbi:MAG: hypothetical protein HY904_10445 [Deltaproteobacteria bacterium]|nr:hypothetical protein [Deltaproteobacteria bacterium]